MRFVLGVLAALACGTACSNDKSKLSTGSGSGSGSIAVVVGSGAGSDGLDAVVADVLVYGEKMSPMLLAFDGNCDAQVERMLALEPLVSTIRSRTATFNDEQQGALRARLSSQRDAILAKVDTQLAAMHSNREAVDAKDKEIKAKCGDNSRYQDAMSRIGLFKKKH